jgi:predicted Fe-Mo cluster-binding NifX family protein
MTICIPTLDSSGLESRLSDHFGSAPWFILIELPSRVCTEIANQNAVHEHGKCNPVSSFVDSHPDIVICRGIGPGAILKLESNGIAVYRASVSTVKEAVDLFEKGECAQVTMKDACQSHGGCGAL